MSRIAFISTLHDVPWGGSEALWFQAALQLKKRGHQVLANTQHWPQPPKQIEELQRAGVEIHARRGSTPGGILARVKNKIAPALSRPDTDWLQSASPELAVISLHCHGSGLEWMEACRASKIPYLVVVHAVVDFWWPGDDLQKPLAESYNQAAKLFFVSDANHGQVQTQLADALGGARVIRNPFNVSFDAATTWPAGSTLYLACVGRLDAGNKGQDILLAALGGEKWKTRDWKLSFFGGGPHRESLRALSEHLKLQDKVEVGGFTSDVESIWQTHHALVLSSRAEGLPIVIVEAMLCGRACLVTDVAGNAELIKDNVSGFVAAAPKREFVDEALERLWQSWKNNQLQTIGQNARQAARDKIPSDPAAVFADEIEDILNFPTPNPELGTRNSEL